MSSANGFQESIILLNKALHQIHLDPKALETIINSVNHDSGKHIPNSHIIAFENKEGCLKLLEQSHILQGTKQWIVEELMPTLLQHKKEDFKKMQYMVHKEGKGWASIQEFWTL